MQVCTCYGICVEVKRQSLESALLFLLVWKEASCSLLCASGKLASELSGILLSWGRCTGITDTQDLSLLGLGDLNLDPPCSESTLYKTFSFWCQFLEIFFSDHKHSVLYSPERLLFVCFVDVVVIVVLCLHYICGPVWNTFSTDVKFILNLFFFCLPAMNIQSPTSVFYLMKDLHSPLNWLSCQR